MTTSRSSYNLPPKKSPRLSFLSEQLIAHRGLHSGSYNNLHNNIKSGNFVLENSLLAFSHAIIKHYSIELDIQLLKDHNLIVYHDSNTFRLSNISRPTFHYTLPEIKKLNPKIPTFEETLHLVSGKTSLIIELKSSLFTNYRLLCQKTLQYISNYCEKYPNAKIALKSFDPRIVHYLKTHFSSYPIGLLLTSHPFTSSLFGCFLLRSPLNYWCKPDFLSVDKKIVHKKIIQSTRKNLPILSWTFQSPKELSRYKTLADGYIVENF